MSEQERAAFYQAHKDDPNVWGEAGKRDAPRQRGSLGATITVRFSPQDADLIRRVADAKGMSYSDVVRAAVSAFIQPTFSLQVGQPSGIVTQTYNQPTANDREGLRVGGELGQIAVSPPATRSLAGVR